MSPSGEEHLSAMEDLHQRLERGEVVFYLVAPFPLPGDEDRRFLLEQELGAGHKNISYSPHTGKVRGFRAHSSEQHQRLVRILSRFSETTSEWLTGTLPLYCRDWKPDQVSFRPQEEEGRPARVKARNDLLHVDAFPNRPTHGFRILRVFANINPREPRLWITADPFARLLARFSEQVPELSTPTWGDRVRDVFHALIRPGRSKRSTYDRFMLRFHDFLKTNHEFQQSTPRRHWAFPPGSAWLAMTDTCSHAVLRGRYALEHSWFIAPHSLALPEESPPALLEQARQR